MKESKLCVKIDLNQCHNILTPVPEKVYNLDSAKSVLFTCKDYCLIECIKDDKSLFVTNYTDAERFFNND